MSQQSYARVTVTKQEQEQIQKRELLLRQVNKVLSQIDHLCGLITEGGNESEFEMANLRLLGQSNLLTSQSALAHRRGDTEGCHMGLERVARHQERTQSAINKMKSLSPGQKDAAAHVLSNFYSYFNNALATGESDPLPPPSVDDWRSKYEKVRDKLEAKELELTWVKQELVARLQQMPRELEKGQTLHAVKALGRLVLFKGVTKKNTNCKTRTQRAETLVEGICKLKGDNELLKKQSQEIRTTCSRTGKTVFGLQETKVLEMNTMELVICIEKLSAQMKNDLVVQEQINARLEDETASKNSEITTLRQHIAELEASSNTSISQPCLSSSVIFNEWFDSNFKEIQFGREKEKFVDCGVNDVELWIRVLFGVDYRNRNVCEGATIVTIPSAQELFEMVLQMPNPKKVSLLFNSFVRKLKTIPLDLYFQLKNVSNEAVISLKEIGIDTLADLLESKLSDQELLDMSVGSMGDRIKILTIVSELDVDVQKAMEIGGRISGEYSRLTSGVSVA